MKPPPKSSAKLFKRVFSSYKKILVQIFCLAVHKTCSPVTISFSPPHTHLNFFNFPPSSFHLSSNLSWHPNATINSKLLQYHRQRASAYRWKKTTPPYPVYTIYNMTKIQFEYGHNNFFFFSWICTDYISCDTASHQHTTNHSPNGTHTVNVYGRNRKMPFSLCRVLQIYPWPVEERHTRIAGIYQIINNHFLTSMEMLSTLWAKFNGCISYISCVQQPVIHRLSTEQRFKVYLTNLTVLLSVGTNRFHKLSYKFGSETI